MKIVSLLKKLPIDVGQAERKHNSAGKLIAFSFVRDVFGEKALDIGCRDGYWSEQLKTKGYRVSSLDVDPNYKFALKHDVETGLPYEAKSFDLVWCTEVIEHLHDPKYLLSEIERVIKPGGLAVITTPNSWWWLYWLVSLWGWAPRKLQNSDHKQFFKESDIRSLAPGYEVLGYFPYTTVFLTIHRFVGALSPTFVLVCRFPG